MINFKKEKLIKKHLGVLTPDWIVQNCIKMLNEFEDEVLTIPNLNQQRELLLAYEKFRMGHTLNATDKWHEENVDLFLTNNCLQHPNKNNQPKRN